MTLLRYAYWRVRGYEKAKGYYLKSTLYYHYNMWAQYRTQRKIAAIKLSELAGKKFVYFPLHIEPEMALHGISPEYFYQHAAIAALARDLPAGVLLAVKEAYGSIGRRPKEFYRQIADLKNVVWLETWEPGIACAQAASAVATICGTAGLEAACSGRSVVSFGQHNLYNFLSSVYVINNERELAGCLRQALDRTDSEAIRAEALRLVQAVVDCSVDLEQYDYIDLDSYNAAVVDRLCAALMSSWTRDSALPPSAKSAA